MILCHHLKIMSENKWQVALIDADRIVMGAGFGSEKRVKGNLISVDPPAFACHKAKMILNKIKAAVPADEYRLFIGDSTIKHFRYNIAKTLPYKENRRKTKRPENEQVIRDYLCNYHNTTIVQGIEVDDMLGIEQMRLENSILCSNDKDLDMIPGWHYDIDWGIKRAFNDVSYTMKAYKKTNTYFITDPGFLALRCLEVDGKRGKKVLVGGGQMWFCAQLLMGDKCDNIPGVPLNNKSNYGPVAAYEALKDCKTYKEAVQTCWEIYKKQLFGNPEQLILDRFKEVAQLVWIKRAEKEKIFPREWLV